MGGKGKLQVQAAEPLPGDDFYLVSGEAISVMRNGKVVQLRGSELKRVRKWVVDRAAPPNTEQGSDRG